MKVSEILNEVTIFDERKLLNTKWASPRELSKWLRSSGFKRIGGGYYSVVYGKPGHKRVVKISTQQDDCWISFARWAMKLTANSHLPNIYWIKFYEPEISPAIRDVVGSRFFVTVMERLQPMNRKNIMNINEPVIIAAMLDPNGVFLIDSEVVYSYLNARLAALLGFKKHPGKIVKYEEVPDETIEEILEKNHSHKFIKTLNTIAKHPGGKGCQIDIHEENIMFRNDGTPVITDPWA